MSADNPDVADPTSARIILKINQPTIGHNGDHRIAWRILHTA